MKTIQFDDVVATLNEDGLCLHAPSFGQSVFVHRRHLPRLIKFVGISFEYPDDQLLAQAVVRLLVRTNRDTDRAERIAAAFGIDMQECKDTGKEPGSVTWT